MNSNATPRRIVLLPVNGDLHGPAEEVLAPSDATHAHVKLRMLADQYSSARMLAAEYRKDGAWVRFLWRRGGKGI